jgi:hypothetical protein
VLPQLKGVAKALYSTGEIVSVGPDGAVFALAVGVPIDRAQRARPDVERLLGEHLGRPLALRIVEHGDAEALGGGGAGNPARPARPGTELSEPTAVEPEPEDASVIDIHALENADDVAQTGLDRLTRVFPGATVVQNDEVTP